MEGDDIVRLPWSEEKSLSLIEAYKARDILWNPLNKNYYKKHLKDDAWTEISELMSVSKETCYNKMVSILSSYRREKLKEKKSTTEKGASDYSSRWFAFDAMKFLDERNPPRKKRITEPPNQEKSTNRNINESTPSLPPTTTSNENETTKPKETNNDDIILKEVRRSEKTNGPFRISSNSVSAITKSFASFVAAKMSSYSHQTRTSVEHSILEILMKADKGHYESWGQEDGFHPHDESGYLVPIKSVDMPGFVDQPSTSIATRLTRNENQAYSNVTVKNEDCFVDVNAVKNEDSSDSYSMNQAPLSVSSRGSSPSHEDDFIDLFIK